MGNLETAKTSRIESFTVKGIAGESAVGEQRVLTASHGTAAPRLTLKGYGVGIVGMRALPQSGATLRPLQIELYVERMEIVP